MSSRRDPSVWLSLTATLILCPPSRCLHAERPALVAGTRHFLMPKSSNGTPSSAGPSTAGHRHRFGGSLFRLVRTWLWKETISSRGNEVGEGGVEPPPG